VVVEFMEGSDLINRGKLVRNGRTLEGNLGPPLD